MKFRGPMVSFPRGPVSLRSNLLVTLDCQGIGVSLDCPQHHTRQGQPAKNSPHAPSLWNPEISAWATRQGGEPRFQAFCFSTPSASLLCYMCLNVLPSLCPSVCQPSFPLYHSASGRSLTLKAWNLGFLDMFPHILTQMIRMTLFCLQLCYILCPVKDTSTWGNLCTVMGPTKCQSLIPASCDLCLQYLCGLW